MIKNWVDSFIVFLFIGLSIKGYSQQNTTMYTLPVNPQVNTLNPAFQSSCRLFIGVPVLSSIHINYGNDAFSYHQLFWDEGGVYSISSSNLSPGNFYSSSTEVQTALLNVGFWIKKKYITFSIHDKADAAIFFTKDLFTVATSGNSPYEGREADFTGSGGMFDYRREYALGISQAINDNTIIGIKGKLLFGKLNAVNNVKKTDLYTDNNTFDLTLNVDAIMNASLPVTFTLDQFGKPTNFNHTGSLSKILFNRSNLGLAFDIGFIKKQDETTTISGSILDLGFIRYSSTPNNYKVNGQYNYTGTINNSAGNAYFFEQMADSIFNNLNTTLTNDSYFTFLSPRLYLSYSLQYTPKTNFQAVATTKLYRFKINPGVSLVVNHQLFKNTYVALSWSYLYRSLKNIGTGIVIGKSPVQFYMFSDNILGIVDPLNARNINLRFGINLIFGCSKKQNYKSCGCEGMQKSVEKNEKLQKLLRK